MWPSFHRRGEGGGPGLRLQSAPVLARHTASRIPLAAPAVTGHVLLSGGACHYRLPATRAMFPAYRLSRRAVVFTFYSPPACRHVHESVGHTEHSRQQSSPDLRRSMLGEARPFQQNVNFIYINKMKIPPSPCVTSSDAGGSVFCTEITKSVRLFAFLTGCCGFRPSRSPGEGGRWPQPWPSRGPAVAVRIQQATLVNTAACVHACVSVF